jgi:hypothetical protein
MGRDIIQLNNNIIPKGLVPLENLFDENDMANYSKITTNEDDVEDYNIGTEENQKMIKLLKMLSPDIKQDYVKLTKEFPDVFTWSYDHLKVYDTKVIQHVIPLKEDQKPFKQIIFSLRLSKWVANLVPVIRKSGEIRLCVDFRNLKKVSLKDHYPLPKMDYILQKVVGS